MKSEIISLSEYAFLAEIAIVLFVGVFVGSIVWMFRPGSKRAYAERSRMPLDDVNPVEYLPPARGRDPHRKRQEESDHG